MKFKCQQVCPYNTLSGCKVDEYYGICPLSNSVQLKESPMTNADRIRAMSDEELRDWLCSNTECGSCKWERWDGCELMEWLKQPAKEDD